MVRALPVPEVYTTETSLLKVPELSEILLHIPLFPKRPEMRLP